VNTINKKLIVIALTAALVFLVSLGSAWAAPVDCCPDGSPASKYPMRVYVYDTENNNPVRSAAVTISGPSFSVTNYTAKNGWTPVVRKINLDGDYTITVQKSGYSPVTETHSMSGGDYVCEPYIFNIGLGAPCEHSLQVCVYNADTGASISGASVTLSGPGSYSAKKTTGSNGCTAVFDGDLQTGTYTANVSAAGYISGSATVTVSPEDCDLVMLPVELEPCEPSLQVCVSDADTGNPISGASVTLSGPGSYSAGSTTGSDGCTGIFNGDLLTGTYTANVTAAGYASDSATVTIGPDDCGLVTLPVELEPCEPSLKVCVYDADTGAPVSGASVTLSGPGSYSAGGLTGSNGCTGTFTGSLQAGAYTANVVADNYLPGNAAGTINQDECGLVEIRVDLLRCERSLQVCVQDKATGDPIPGAYVLIQGPSSYSADDSTSDDGCTGVFDNIKAGGYTVRAIASGYSSNSVSFNIGYNDCGRKDIIIELEEKQCEGRFLQVNVYSGSTPVSGATVDVTGPDSYSAAGVTDSSGKVQFDRNLPDGEYAVKVNKTGYFQGTATATITRDYCGTLMVRVNLTLCSVNCDNNSFRTYVYDEDTGNPIRTAVVTIAGPNYTVVSYTDKKGWTPLVLGAKLPGTYTITATKSGYSAGSVSVQYEDYCGQQIVNSIGLKKD